jgi:hypothetical protein
VAGTGCSFQRTNDGFVVGSHWSLECCDHAPWVEFRPTTDLNGPDSKPGSATASSSGVDATAPPKSSGGQDQQAAGKPELLPWGSRLKDYRLAARVDGKEEGPSETAEEASAKLSPSARPSEPVLEAKRPDPVIE